AARLIGGQREGPLHGGEGGLQLAVGLEGFREIVVRVDVAGLPLERLSQRGGRLAGAAAAEERHAEMIVGRGMPGAAANCLAKIALRLGGASPPGQEGAALDQDRPGIVAIGDRAVELLERLLGLATLFEECGEERAREGVSRR